MTVDRNLQPIAITMGDPSGVGAEVIVKALAEKSAEERARYLVVGDRDTLIRAIDICKLTVDLTSADDASGKGIRLQHVPVEDLPNAFGVFSPRCGEASFQYIKWAVDQSLNEQIAGIVTAPINKAALNDAGHHYDGHTGLLAALTGTKSSFMLLASERLRVIHVSTHVSLQDAIGRAQPDRILATIRAGNDHLRRIGYDRPRIAVAGINPHCGENGLFGTEDDEQIRPAVEQARAAGLAVSGPIPADTCYHRAYEGEFDLVIAQYHDQGHIPIKLVAFDTAVNVTVGLPIDRTSVDHGTAFDIAGTGRANHTNMNAALAYAARLAGSR